MHNRFLFLLFIHVLSLGILNAQNIQLIMSPNPSPYISDWQTRIETAILVISNPDSNGISVKVAAELYDGSGALVAYTDPTKTPVLFAPPGVNQFNPEDIFPLYAVIYKGKVEQATAKTGRIPDDNYRFCVTLVDPKTGEKIGTSGTVCKTFTIVAYQAPILQTPRDKEKIPEIGINGIVFRWAPVTPSPKGIVTYRLQVFEVLEGQENMTALRSNQPIVEKDLKGILQTQWPIDFPMPEVGRKYVWTVTPLDEEDRNLVDGYGFAQPFVFNVGDDNINIKIDSINIGCCEKGKQNVYIRIKNMLLTNPAQITVIKYRVNGTGPLLTLSPTTPALPFTINANTTKVFNASIKCVDSMRTIKFIVNAIWPGDPDNINNETIWDTLHCACDDCDEKHLIINAPAPPQISFSNNIISFNQAITATFPPPTPPKPIKSIKAELVYFEMVPENDYCIPCNKDSKTYGHFANGTNSLEWNGLTSLKFEITTPQLTPCCSVLFKWCIRYKIEFKDCTTCNKLVCYETKKKGCDKIIENNKTN